MRHVVSSQQVAHLFANQSQGDARNSSLSVSFEGDVAYSYRTPVARVFDLPPNTRIMLLSSNSYSPTTAKHLSFYQRAADGPVFRVPSLGTSGGRHWESYGTREVDHAVNMAYLVKEADKAILRLSRMRSRPYGTNWTTELCRRVDTYAYVFGLPIPERNWDSEITAAHAKTLARVEAAEARYNTPEAIAERERRIEREAQHKREERERLMAELADNLVRWRAGEDVDIPYHVSVMLRVKADGRVQTSQGAEVLERSAMRLYRALKSGVTDFSGWTIDGFPVRGVSDECLMIGCHSIPMAEVERFATDRGW